MRRIVFLLCLLVGFSLPAGASDLAGFLASIGFQYEVGEEFDVTVTLDNTSTFGGGPLNTTNPTAVLTIPNGVTVKSWSIQGGSCMESGNTLTCTYPSIAAGATEMFSVTLEGTMVGMYEMPLVVSHDDSDPNSSNNSAQLTFTITEPTFPVLETSKTPSLTNLGIGELVTYTIVVRNTGTADATGVQVQDALPEGLEYVSSSNDCVYSVGVLTCTTPSLPPNTFVEYTVTASTTKAGSITNTASATSAEVTTPATATAEITVRKRADVSIVKDMADRAIFGPGTQVFTLTVTNNGPDDADNVTVTDNMPLDPQSTMPVFSDPTLPQGCSGGQAVECNLGTLGAGESRVITFGAGFNPELFGTDPLVRPDIVSYTNTASVSTSSNDENASNNESSVSGKVLAPPGEGQDAPWTEWVNDPVNPATGEIADTFPADLTLSGPYPVYFARSYGSFLDTQGVVASGLGPNWSHNFAWKVDIVDAFGEMAYRLVSPSGRTTVFGKDENDNLVQESALFAPMQLKATGNGFMAGDPRTGVVRTFDAEGRMVAERPRSGAGLTMTYDDDGLASVTDGLGRTLTFTWNAGRIAAVSDGTRTVSYTYAGDDWLTAFTNAAGGSQTFAYASGFDIPMLSAHAHEDGVARFTQTFDARGRVVTQVDALGGTTTFSYGDEATTLTDPEGRTTTYAFDDNGRLASKTDAAGTVVYEYDDTGRRASITDRTGKVTRFAYDAASGAPTSVTFSDGSVQRATYVSREDADGFTVYDVASRTDEVGNTTSYALDSQGNRVTETLPSGESRSTTWNGQGQPESVTVSGKGTTSFTYDGNGNLVSIESPDGRQRAMTWDAFGRLTALQHEDGTSSAFVYDALDRVTELGNRDGTSVRHTFDAVGNLVAIQDETGATANQAYDAMNQLVREGDFLGNEKVYTYNAVGQILSSADASGRTTTYSYDSAGNRVSMTDPAGRTTSYTHDAEGVLTGTTFPGGATNTVSRNARGWVASVEDAASSTMNLTRNAAGDITGVTGPTGTQSTMTLDASGRIAAMDHDGGSIGISYDGAGRISAISNPLGSTISLALDAAGRMTSRTDGLGRTTSYTWDTAGRMESVSFPDGGTMTYGYDAMGRLTRIDGGDVSHAMEYDQAGRLTSGDLVALGRDGNGRIISSNGIQAERDAAGRILRFSYPQGDVSYSYDGGGRLSTVTDWDGRVTTFAYDDAGRVVSVGRPNGTNVNYTYTTAGVLTQQVETKGTIRVMGVSLERDAAGLVQSASYEGMLVPEESPVRDDAVTIDGAYQIEGFTWDERGRLLADDRNSFGWNGLNRVTAVDDTGLAYDALGMPNTIGDESWTWNYMTALPTPALHEGVAMYIYTPAGELLYRVDAASGDAWFYHFDEMGSTRLITDDTGNVVAAYTYDPFGRSLGSWGDLSPALQPFTYRGQAGTMDLGGDVYHMRTRVYDAWTARFISPDPLFDVNPLHVNPYQYAANNPSVFSDPLGQRENFATGIGVAGIYQTTVETLEALSKKGTSVRDLINSGKIGSVIMHGDDGLTKAFKLTPNASGAISAIAEAYTSGNVARGLGVGAVDIALTANPYLAPIVIASDLIDVGVGVLSGGEISGPRLADIWRNGGRVVGSIVTDIVLAPTDGHDFGDSLSDLADDMYDQGGVPGMIFDAGASAYIALGHYHLEQLYDAKAEAEVIDRAVRLKQLERNYEAQRELREFFRPLNNR